MTGEEEKFEQLSMFAPDREAGTTSSAKPKKAKAGGKSKGASEKGKDTSQDDGKNEILVEIPVEIKVETKDTGKSQSQTREKKNMQTPEKSIDFEASLTQLEAVVKELDGEVKLEQALKLFEEGIKLSVECEKFIKGAEQKIEILKKQADGSIEPESFEHEAQKLMAGE